MAQLVKTMAGLAIASVKTVAGLAIASVKTVMGLDNTSGGGGSPAFVQAQIGVEYFNADANIAVAFTSNVTAGNLIAICASWSDEAQTISSVTDSLGNSYTLVGAAPLDSGAGFSSQGAYAMNVTGGACTVTVTFSGSNSNKTISVVECSGCATTGALDGNVQTYLNVGAGTDSQISSNFTTTQNGCIIIGFGMSPSQNGGTITAGTNFTMRDTDNTSSANVAVETRIQATASATTTISFTNSAFGDRNIIGMAFKP